MPNPESGRSQADKDKSKQLSRPVTGNQPPRSNGRISARPGGGGPRRSDQQRGGGRGAGKGPPSNRRAPQRPASKRPRRRSSTALLTWGTAALVIVIVAILIAVKVFGGSSLAGGSPRTPASPQIVAQVAGIPASVFDAVGTTSDVAPITPPFTISNQKLLTFPDPTTGKELPGVFYYGAEYCPYCAAERWAIIAALSRFGTFHHLSYMQSSSSDVYPNTPTFSFYKSTYTSPYIVFRPVESLSNQLNAAGNGYATLQNPTPEELALLRKYNSPTYFPSQQAGAFAFPFINFGNKLLSELSYSPGILTGLTRDQIAGGLRSSKNPITQAIVASANYISAAVCAIDGQQPSAVCTSSGVQTAAKTLTSG